jgi:hypothetical protein
MFLNRVYFTTQKTYQRIRVLSNSKKNISTFSNGGGNGPKNDYVITAILVGFGLYIVNRR